MIHKCFLCLCIGVVIFAGCRKPEDPVSSAIENKMSKGEGAIINLAELTNFEWEKVYFFGPYETKDTIQKSIGCQFEEPNGFVFVEEWDYLLVFVKDNKVVHYCTLIGMAEHIIGIKNHKWFSSQNAQFKVVKRRKLQVVECNSIEGNK